MSLDKQAAKLINWHNLKSRHSTKSILKMKPHHFSLPILKINHLCSCNYFLNSKINPVNTPEPTNTHKIKSKKNKNRLQK